MGRARTLFKTCPASTWVKFSFMLRSLGGLIEPRVKTLPLLFQRRDQFPPAPNTPPPTPTNRGPSKPEIVPYALAYLRKWLLSPLLRRYNDKLFKYMELPIVSANKVPSTWKLS